jgi:DNA-binding NtrC family response regulator
VNDGLRGKRLMYKGLARGFFAMSVILIVEDDEQVRVLAESVLRDASYGVLAATALEGAQALLNSNQLIDLLFVDVNLGGDLEAGLRIAQNAREVRPFLPIVYTTGQGVDDGKKALFAEPYLFLPKPYTSEQLISSIAYLLNRNGGSRPPPDLPTLAQSV